MNTLQTSSSTAEWKGYELILFRFVFIYLFFQVLPIDVNYWKFISSINWLHITYGDIFNLTRFSPKFFPGAVSYANWVVVAVVAIIGTVVWSIADKETKEYNTLYYWMRVIVRYRLESG